MPSNQLTGPKSTSSKKLPISLIHADDLVESATIVKSSVATAIMTNLSFSTQ